MLPIGSDCTVHCTPPPYPQQPGSERQKGKRNDEERKEGCIEELACLWDCMISGVKLYEGYILLREVFGVHQCYFIGPDVYYLMHCRIFPGLARTCNWISVLITKNIYI